MNQPDHSYFQQRLSAYADGELEPLAHAHVEEHLRNCPECRERLQEIERLGEFVAQESGLAESEYWERAAQQIERAVETSHPRTIDLKAERSLRRTSPWWWRAPAIAASVLFVGYIALHESSILRDEVLAPAPSSETKPAPQLEAISTHIDTPASGMGETLGEVPKIPPTAAPSVAKEESFDKRVRDQEGLPKPASVEKTDRQETGLIGQETTTRTESELPLKSGYTEEQKADRASREQTAASGRNDQPLTPEKSEDVAIVRKPPAEEVGSDEADQNYQPRTREKGTFVLRDTLQITPEMYSVAKAREDGLSTLQQEELTYWRTRRDSLAELTSVIRQQDSSPMGKALKYAMTPLRQSGGSALSSVDPQSETRNQTEAGLLEAWYQVCRLTPDSTEINKGVDFIEKVAEARESANWVSANEYLKQLGRQ